MFADLCEKDIKEVSDCAQSIVESASLDELRRRTVDGIGQLIGSTLTAWNEVDPATGRIDAVLSRGMDPDLLTRLQDVFVANIADHPVISHHGRTGDVRPYSITDFVTGAAFRQTGLYSDFYRYLEADDQLSFIVAHDELIVGVALNRDGRGFSDRDRSICMLLQPVVSQTQRLLRYLSGDTLNAIFARHGLTARESQVMALVGQGHRTKQIAAELRISNRTAEKHIQHALTKLDVRTRLEAVTLLAQRVDARP